MNGRYLIISADDFGLNGSTNDAVAELFCAERITSAGILAPASKAGEACRMAAQHGWSVGVHWTLHSEWGGSDRWPPQAGADKSRSLLEDGLLAYGTQAVKRADSRDVSAELDAQYRFLVSCGCTPDHADSHGGTLYGINGRLFFLNAFRLCRKYRLPFRFGRNGRFMERQFEKRPGAALRIAHRAVCGCAGLYGVSLPDDFYSEPHPVARIDHYSSLKAYYETQLSGCGGGVTEVFLHPALPDEEMLKRNAEWQKRVWEYEYLKSGDLTQLAQKLGFTLISWRDFSSLVK